MRPAMLHSLLVVIATCGMTDAWLTKKEQWCASTDKTISCDSTSVIHVHAAFFNRRQAESCPPLRPAAGVSCEPNATDAVAQACENRQSCALTPALYAACDNPPFTFIRAVWECVAGVPDADDAEPEAQVHDDEKRLDEEDPSAPETPPDSPPATEPNPPDDAPDTPEDWDALDALQRAMTTLHDEAKASEEAMSALHLDNLLQDLGMEDLNDPNVVLDFVPCWRSTPMDKLMKLKLTEMWQLSSCMNEDEGCFKVNFEGGRVFDDPKVPPTSEQFISGDVAHGADKWWVTRSGLGLQRNDYKTWGVCLPKNSGIKFALGLFNVLKRAHHKLCEEEPELCQEM